MRMTDSFFFVQRSLTTHKLRTFLSALGIGIGIASVVLLTSIGKGLQEYVAGEFTQFGTNVLQINPGTTTTLGVSPGVFGTNRPLTIADSELLRRLKDVEAVVPVIQGNASIEAGKRQRRTEIIGVGPDALSVWKLEVLSGHFLPQEDPELARPIVVLGYTIFKELFPDGKAVGQFMRIGNYRFRVVGTLKAKGNILGFDMDTLVYIPAARAQEIFNREGLMEIDITYTSSVPVAVIVARIEKTLARRHGRVDFTILTQGEMLAVLDKILEVLTLSIGALGAISLLVGAVGIITLMTIAVAERVAEIGLLKALGAKAKDVLLLFLGEALILAILGGLGGFGFAAFIILVAKLAVPTLPLQISVFYSSLALAVSAIIGIIAGVAPARRAAQLNPIDALRDE